MTGALTDFVRTGTLGPIHPELSLDAVRAIIGPPNDWSVNIKHPILKYGDVELHFYENILATIVMKPRGSRLTLPAATAAPYQLLRHRGPLQAVLDLLTSEGIHIKIDGWTTSDELLRLCVPDSNVSLTFDERGYLASLSAGAGAPRTEIDLDTRWWSPRAGGCRLPRRSTAIRTAALFYCDEYVGRTVSAVANGLLVEEGPVLLSERDISPEALGELVVQFLRRSRRNVAPGTLDLSLDQQGHVVDPFLKATRIQPAKRFYRHARHVIVEEHANQELDLIPMDLIAAEGVYSWPGADRIRRFVAPSALELGEVLIKATMSE